MACYVVRRAVAGCRFVACDCGPASFRIARRYDSPPSGRSPCAIKHSARTPMRLCNATSRGG
jgi:hypothetical protein